MDVQALYDLFKKHKPVFTDSRLVTPGGIFFALQGKNYDGHKFAAEALNKGASYAVVSDYSLEGEQYFHVDDTLVALQELAQYHRRNFNIPVIAITGSNGKTTTKELVAAVLSQKFKVHFTQGNLNNHIGVPLTLLSMPTDAEIAVIEMGANHIGEIDALCRIAMPTHGLITNIGKAHLEGFGSFEGVKKAKGELFEYLKSNNGYAFVNADDPSLVEMGEYMINKTSYGLTPDLGTDVFFEYHADGQNGFTISDKSRPVTIHSRMFGHYNAINMVAAFTVGVHFQVETQKMITSLSSYIPGNNRSEVIDHKNTTIVKDAYNANPSSMEMAILAFGEQYKNGWLVLGDMKELGGESVEAHKQILDLTKTRAFERVYLVGNEFNIACKASGLHHDRKYRTFNSVDELKKIWNWGDCKGKSILLKGSRSMKLEQLLEA